MLKAFKSLVLLSALTLISTLATAALPPHPYIVEKPFNLADFRGKWVVISYWATWCNICLEEIPVLNAFYKAHKNEVVMFGFNYDDEGNLAEHIKEGGVNFPTLKYDPKRLFNVAKISVLPTIFLVGPDGRLKQILTGLHSQQDIETALHRLK